VSQTRGKGDLLNDSRTNWLDRRGFLRLGAGVAMAVIAPRGFAKIAESPARELAFNNLHTGEQTRTVFWEQGQHIHTALNDINHVLRDHRSGESTTMDPALLDLLYNLQQKVQSSRPFQVISGYRSPASNAKLRKNSNGVAKKSLHMQGKAIDIRLPGIELNDLRQAALSLKAGGVGYYPKANFIHVDTGRVRFW
jgi:uncharacterized protein YcbK (DUF882 family)